MLLKVKYNKNNRRDIIEICDIMKTEIVDMSKHFMMLQICDSEPEPLHYQNVQKMMIKIHQS